MATSNLNRKLEPLARDTSIIPDGEVDLVPITLTQGTLATSLSFSTAANFAQAIPDGFYPGKLVLQGDGAFFEGQATPLAAVNLSRAASTNHEIPVQGREGWNLLRNSTNSTVIRGKLLLGS